MKKKSKLKLALIPDVKIRKQTFKKRRRGFLKKLNELVTLCDIKACAIIHSPFQSNPEAFPSSEAVEEVVSKFMALPDTERTKKMLNQEAYLWERIKKGKEKLKTLRDENRESYLRELMFDCLKGKTEGHNLDSRDIQDLGNFIDHYISQLNHRIKTFRGIGESSSFPPPPFPYAPALVSDAALPTVADTAPVDVPIRFYDQIQYHNMNMHEENPIQYQYMDVNANLNQDLNFNQTLDLKLDSNPYPSHQPSFKELLMGFHEPMGYVGEHGNIPFTIGSNQQEHQFPVANLASSPHFSIPNITNDFATSSHKPYITADDFAPYINNGISTNNYMPNVTTANTSGLASCIYNVLSATPHMPSITTANANGIAPYISNNVSTNVSTMASHFPSITSTNVNGSPFDITNDLSTTSCMPSSSTANVNVLSQGGSF